MIDDYQWEDLLEVEVIQYSPIGKYQFSSPSTIQLEITDACQEHCRHCYNFWRQAQMSAKKMTRKEFDFILSELTKNQVFHCILTGGEPLLNFELMPDAIRLLIKNGLSVSCNSNLMAATKEKMDELKKAGLPHILTTLNSYRKDVNDLMVSTPGAYEKILSGIKCARDAGIRISVNMIITKNNINDIYKTAELAAKLGAEKFNATRTVPPVGEGQNFRREFEIDRDNAIYMLEQLARIEQDFNLIVGGLIAFPHCLLGDLSAHRSLLMRGCPSGSKMLSINVNGDSHACVHEEKSYGNIFDIGLKACWKNMKEWRTGEFIPSNCKTCSLFDYCNAGCRMMGLSYFGSIGFPDNLKIAETNIPTNSHQELFDQIIKNKFDNSPGIRVREEDGFLAINVFGAETFVGKWRR